MDKKSRVLEPTTNTIGLIVSFLTAISPIFVDSSIADYFANGDLVIPASFAAVIVGILISWNIIENHQFVHFVVPSKKEYGRFLQTKHMVWLTAFMSIVSFTTFFVADDYAKGYVQMLAYILFFNFLIAGFSLLISNSRDVERRKQEEDYLPSQIINTLENNGQINRDIKIISNTPMDGEALRKLGVNEFNARGVVFQKADEEEQMVVLSYDAKRLLTVVDMKK